MTCKPKKGQRKRQKSGLNRKLLDVAIGMIRESIKYKLEEAGGIFLEAPTQQLNPTQRCNECWELTPKTLHYWKPVMKNVRNLRKRQKPSTPRSSAG